MQICRELAGYSLGRADIVRRAMSKKKAKEMEREHKVFIEGLEDDEGNIIVEGALRRGVSREAAEGIFSEIQTFSEYAFNKSHAAAYAVVAYQTAYLKYHYPREYMAALLTSVLNERGKISEYIAECQRMGIGVLPPHVNRSSMKFTVEGNDIRFGLLAIKNLGGGVIAELIDERERNGDFLTFYSLCDRMYGKSLNRRALECLVQSGALDGLAASRRQMLASIDIVINDLNSRHNGLVEGQIGLFDIADIPREMREPALAQVEEFSRAELLAMEKEVTEIYLSGHPMTEHLQLTERLGCDKIAEIHALKEDVASDGDGKSVRMLLLISSVKLKVTKNNETMAFVQAEDVSGTIEIIIFPRTLSENSAILTEGSVVGLDGRVSLREDEDAKVVCEKLYSLEAMQSRNGRVHPSYHTDSPAPRQDEQPKKPSERAGLYLRVTALESQEFLRAKKVLRIFDGQTAVYVYCTDIKKLMLAPRDLWVDVNDVMLLELKNILGDNNVSMKQ